MITHATASAFRSAVHPAVPMQLPARVSAISPQRLIRILMVDDHPVARKGMVCCLARQENLQIVGEASDGEEAIRKARVLLPDIILTDIDMPHMNGLMLTEQLHRELPQIKVVLMSAHRATNYIVRAIQSGARGYLLKDASADELTKAI